MTKEKAIKILRNEIECLSHDRCPDCPLYKVCDQLKISSDSEYMEAFDIAIQVLSAIEDIKAEITRVVEEENVEDTKWAAGLRYSLKIIDKYISGKGSK